MKVLYDYEAMAPGELTVHENDVLLVFESEEDWLLVQDSRTDGRAGYVPGNYVEVIDEDSVKEPTPTSNRIVVPESVSMTSYWLMIRAHPALAPETCLCGSRRYGRLDQSHR